MSVQIRFFTIPAEDPDAAAEELNRFLRGSRVLRVYKQFVERVSGAYWSLAVEHVPDPARWAGSGTAHDGSGSKPRIDYRDVLTEVEFSRFRRLRERRKQLAAEHAQPVYAILTNEQLAEIARRLPSTKAELQAIPGIGEGKATRYGDAFLAEVSAIASENAGNSVHDPQSGPENPSTTSS